MTKQIEDSIREHLFEEAQTTALEFVGFLRRKNIKFYKDNGSCWKDKIYYWLQFNEECIAFIAIKDPDEPENDWTIWSDDSRAYEDSSAEEAIKNIAWKYVNHCSNCGSCDGGKHKIVFGKNFDRVCGCTFRIDNPTTSDLPFLKKMVELRKNDILNKVCE